MSIQAADHLHMPCVPLKLTPMHMVNFTQAYNEAKCTNAVILVNPTDCCLFSISRVFQLAENHNSRRTVFRLRTYTSRIRGIASERYTTKGFPFQEKAVTLEHMEKPVIWWGLIIFSTNPGLWVGPCRTDILQALLPRLVCDMCRS